MRKKVNNCGGILAKGCSKRYLNAALPIVLALFIILSGCEWGEDPANYYGGTRYYTVTFISNGNTGGSAPAPMQAAEGSNIMLPSQGNMTKDGYSFEGWQTTSSGYIGNNGYAANIYTTNIPYTIAGRDTLYARWINHTYYYGTLTDTRDGQTYKTVKIGDQTWMAENLNYWTQDSSWCYDNNTDNCNKYGRLYSWNTAMAGSLSSNENPSRIQGICPYGWHLPSENEWSVLLTTVGSYSGTKLKAISGWDTSEKRYHNGTNEYGFSALPGGDRHADGSFNHRTNTDVQGLWWSTTEYGSDKANSYNINGDYTGCGNSSFTKAAGYSVRCIQN